MDYVALKAELTNDPAGVGYAAPIALGSDSGCADLINATTGPGSSNVSLIVMSKDDFLVAIFPVTLALAAATSAIQSKWDRILSVVCGSQSLISMSVARPAMQLAIADGIFTLQQASSVGVRIGSRAEVLFGAGVTVSSDDVAIALRGNI